MNDHQWESGWADLHLHSYCSDGVFSPSQIVDKAAAMGLKAVSITDHDSVRGIQEALIRAKLWNLEVIPGVELSTRDGELDVHILGYFIDPKDRELSSYLRRFQKERLKRAKKIVAKLAELGVNIELEEVLQRTHNKGSIGRPHIADTMIERGYVQSYDEAFYKYLGNGKPAYVPKFKISPTEAIDLIHRAGGIAVLAHPGMDLAPNDVLHLITLDFDGIEILHPKHSSEKVNFFYQLALKHNLLATGGSDCHGDRKGRTLMGYYNVPYRFVQHMKERLKLWRGTE